MLILKGKGDTGKSQLKRLAEYLVGDEYVNTADLVFLSTNRFAVANLYGKRLAGCNDMSTENIKGLDILKKLTGGDKIFADVKNGIGFDFVFNGFLWFNTNAFPSFGGDKGKWVYERIIPIECNNVISKDKQDPNLFKKLVAEKNGIINKALNALDELIENNFKFDINEKILKTRKQYQEDNSSVLQFISEVCRPLIKGSRERTKKAAFYEYYKQWCVLNNYHPKSKVNVKQELEAALDEDGKSFYCNIHNIEYVRSYIVDVEKINQLKYESNPEKLSNTFVTEEEAYAIDNGEEALEQKKIIDMENKKIEMQKEKAKLLNNVLNKSLDYEDYYKNINVEE